MRPTLKARTPEVVKVSDYICFPCKANVIKKDLHQAAMNQRIEQKFDDGIEPNPGKRLTRKAGTAQPGAVIQDSLKTGVKGATEKGKRAGTGETSMGHSGRMLPHEKPLTNRLWCCAEQK